MTYILLDAKNSLYRFGWVGRSLRNSEGVPTGAIYGILRLLLRLKKKYPVSRFVCVWDGAGQGWRHKLFPAYKANRHKEKDIPQEVKDLFVQIPYVKSVLDAIGIPQIEIAGLEADDVIGVLARSYSKKHKVVVYSMDKDFMQLMSMVELIRDVDKKDRLSPETEKKVIARFGCSSKDVLKVRAIAGDHSDGIPNPVAGIGPKTAAKLIASGVDPSSCAYDTSWPKNIKAHWKDIHRNYLLMKLPLSAKDKMMTTDQQCALQSARKRGKEIEGGAIFGLVDILGRLQLSEAMESRRELYHIQST